MSFERYSTITLKKYLAKYFLSQVTSLQVTILLVMTFQHTEANCKSPQPRNLQLAPIPSFLRWPVDIERGGDRYGNEVHVIVKVRVQERTSYYCYEEFAIKT